MRASTTLITTLPIAAAASAGPLLSDERTTVETAYSSELLELFGFDTSEVAAGSLAELANSKGDVGYRTTSSDEFGNLTEARLSMADLSRVVETPHKSATGTSRVRIHDTLAGILEDAMALRASDGGLADDATTIEFGAEAIVDPSTLIERRENLLASLGVNASGTLALLGF